MEPLSKLIKSQNCWIRPEESGQGRMWLARVEQGQNCSERTRERQCQSCMKRVEESQKWPEMIRQGRRESGKVSNVQRTLEGAEESRARPKQLGEGQR